MSRYAEAQDIAAAGGSYAAAAGNIVKQKADEIVGLLRQKALGYGPSWLVTEKCLAALYPDGIPPAAYRDALLTVRVLDKLCRLATAAGRGDAGGESPWDDVIGYGFVAAIARELG